MIYPSQETEIKNFLDELLKKYNCRLEREKFKGGSKIDLASADVENLMVRASELRKQLAVWTTIPEEEPEHVEV